MYSKLLLINQDSVTGDYYLTQYNYTLGTIEYDIQITATTPANLYECNCWLFIVDNLGVSWLLDKTNPYDLLPAETFTYNPISITQVSSCFSAEIPLTTTTTTTILIGLSGITIEMVHLPVEVRMISFILTSTE